MQLSPRVLLHRLVHALFEQCSSAKDLFQLVLVVESVLILINIDVLSGSKSVLTLVVVSDWFFIEFNVQLVTTTCFHRREHGRWIVDVIPLFWFGLPLP